MAEKELKQEQRLDDGQLEDVSGGTRIPSSRANENGADDSVFVGVLETAGPKEGDGEIGLDPSTWIIVE